MTQLQNTSVPVNSGKSNLTLAGKLSGYVTIHPGQLSLVIPVRVGTVNRTAIAAKLGSKQTHQAMQWPYIGGLNYFETLEEGTKRRMPVLTHVPIGTGGFDVFGLAPYNSTDVCITATGLELVADLWRPILLRKDFLLCRLL